MPCKANSRAINCLHFLIGFQVIGKFHNFLLVCAERNLEGVPNPKSLHCLPRSKVFGFVFESWRMSINKKQKLYLGSLESHSPRQIMLVLLAKSMGKGSLPCNRLMGMCCRMGSHFHYLTDHNGFAFSIVTRMRSYISEIIEVRKLW